MVKKDKNIKPLLSEKHNNDIREWIVRIGIVLLFAVCIITLFRFNIKFITAPQPNEGVSIPLLLWDSIMNLETGLVFVIEVIVSILLGKYANNIRKSRIVIISSLILFLSIFDEFAIKYPLHQVWIALVNFVVVAICLTLVLLQKYQCPATPSKDKHLDKDIELTKAFEKTNNRNIIAAQLYKIQTSKVDAHSSDTCEYIKFIVSHIGSDYICPGNDINCISQVTYELDRSIVDSFQIILGLYNNFRDTGNTEIKNTILTKLDEQIKELCSRLSEIDETSRDVTKYDCCIARALTLFLSFKHILKPDSSSCESQADYIGELKLQEGEFNLKPDTEKKLFTLYRTGILGAALLDDKSRHVFQYRKDGTKLNRKYCASQILSIDKETDDEFSPQTIYICLFTIKESETPYVPGYMFKSISERESTVLKMLHTIVTGGPNNG